MIDVFKPESYRIIGIDPGSDTLGIAFMELNLLEGKLHLVKVETLQGHRNARIDPEYAKIHGDRAARLRSHYRILIKVFESYRPHVVISEAPFMARHAAAYAALVECVTYIRFALGIYDRELPLDVIDPPTVKKTVGAMGNADKEQVRAALLKMRVFDNPNEINMEALDEHSIDAIAVALVKAIPLLSYLKEGIHVHP